MEAYDVNGVTIQLLWKENWGCFPNALYMQQCHGTVIHEFPAQPLLEWDGIFSRKWGGSYAVKFADCLCASIIWKEYISLIHIWRRGLYQWLIHHAVQNMCRHWELVIDMEVFLSPCIKHLEVGRDWSDFTDIVPSAFLVKNSQWYSEIDIIWRAKSQFAFHGIQEEAITSHPDCTLSANDARYSYRKDWTSKRNRMVL